MDFFTSIISSIVATAIVAVGVYTYRTGLLHLYRDRIYALLFPTINNFDNDKCNQPRKIRNTLIRLLRIDQSRTGIHYGQLGRNASATEQIKYQTGSEDISIKPRIYLTNWPCSILIKHNLEPRLVRLATIGIERLFVNNRIYVFQSATRQTPPHHQPQMISYRHTICGALLLYHAKGWTSIVRNVLDSMLDTRNGWQKSDGGWSQCDREHTRSDIWGSAYALRLLDYMLDTPGIFKASERSLASDSLSRTIEYFKECWKKNTWTYGKSACEENAVILFIELVHVISKHDRQFTDIVLGHIKQWLSPSGDLCESYLAKCPDIPKAALYARMSYALFLSQKETSDWLPLYYHAIKNIDNTLNSADLSFVLDMTCQL